MALVEPGEDGRGTNGHGPEPTSFPLSHSLPNSPTSPEDGTFSILPRYLLQKVKSTFASSGQTGSGASAIEQPGGSSVGSAATNRDYSSGGFRRPFPSDTTPGPSTSRQRQTTSSTNNSLRPATRQQAPRDISRAGPSGEHGPARTPRISTLSSHRRAAAPVLSKSYSEAPSTVNPLSRSQSRTLRTLPESPLDSAPPESPMVAGSVNGPNSAFPFSSIPGFPLAREDDTKSVSSLGNSNLGVTQIFRRLRGEALSRDYWMADESAVECYDCNNAFTSWRRKHHCRVCGRIFCSRCASNIVPGARFGHEGLVRVCNLCMAVLTHRQEDRVAAGVADLHSSQSHDRAGLASSTSVANLNISLPLESSYRAPQSQFNASVLFPRNDLSSYGLNGNPSLEDLHQYYANNLMRSRRYSDASYRTRPETPDLLDEGLSPQPWHASLSSPLGLGRLGRPRSSVSMSTAVGGSLGAHGSTSPVPPPMATTPAPFRNTAALEDERPLPSPQPSDRRPESPLEPFVRSQDGLPESNINGLGILPPDTQWPESHSSEGYVLHNDASYEASLAGGGLGASSSGRPDTPSAYSYPPMPHALQPIRSRLTSRAPVLELSQLSDLHLSAGDKVSDAFKASLGNGGGSLRDDVEYTDAARAHTSKLLEQMLKQEEIPKWQTWHKHLLKILWDVAIYTQPNVKNGDSMDIRSYIKIKRVPGGAPVDCEYVDGAVFTKSLLNKSLPRLITHPRIMVFDYAFEFEHDGTKLARLDSLRDSEKDSLRKLANSVIDHRPSIVLVGKSVSGLALEYLHRANIIVLRNVKQSVLDAVARATGAGVFNTYQHFPSSTELGRCGVFRAQTIVHSLIPGKRKTLMRFEGCNKALGATILLRGGDIETLSKIKRIMRFMILAAYTMKAELDLTWDEEIAISSAAALTAAREGDGKGGDEDAKDDNANEHDEGPGMTARRIKRDLKPYKTRILSMSPTVIFPPPHSLQRLAEDHMKVEELRKAKTARQEGLPEPSMTQHAESEQATDALNNGLGITTDSAANGSYQSHKRLGSSASQLAGSAGGHEKERTVTQLSYNEMKNGLKVEDGTATPDPLAIASSEQAKSVYGSAEASGGSETHAIPAAAVPTVSRGGEPEGALQPAEALRRSLSDVSLLSMQPAEAVLSVKPETREKTYKLSKEQAEDTRLAEAEQKRNEHLKNWEMRQLRQKDDLTPAAHQNITVLETLVCPLTETTAKLCAGPRVSRYQFYKKGSDQTLREFVVKTILSAGQKCATCAEPHIRHYTTLAHGALRLNVHLKPFVSELPAGTTLDAVYTQSTCKKCPSDTAQWTELTENSCNYSFAKYLELSFYHDHVSSRRNYCGHHPRMDYKRMFRYRFIEISIELEDVNVSDIAFPPLRLRIDAWTQLRRKNDEHVAVVAITNAFWNSVNARIENFRYDLLEENHEAARAAMDDFRARAREDKKWFDNELEQLYEHAPASTPSALNSVRYQLYKKYRSWEEDFNAFEHRFFPSEADKARRMTSTHLRRLFSDPSASVPPTPSSRSTFSPMPSVPPSPALSATIPLDTYNMSAAFSTATLTSQDWSSSGGSSLPPSTPMSPSLQLESLPDIPSLQLTEANLLELTANATRPSEEPAATPSYSSSFIDHGENMPLLAKSGASTPISPLPPTADCDDGSDGSDATVQAEPRRLDYYDSMRSESEDIDSVVDMKPYKARKAKPVPSIANLVQRFEQAPIMGMPPKGRKIPSAPGQHSDSSAHAQARPTMRRGKSDFTEVRQIRNRAHEREKSNVFSDGEMPGSSAATSPWRGEKTSSRMPKSPSKATKSPSAASRRRPNMDTFGSTVSSRSTSSLSVPSVSRPGLLGRSSTASSSRSTVTGRNDSKKEEKNKGSDSPSSVKSSSKTRSIGKAAGKDSRLPVPKASPAFSSRVARRAPGISSVMGTSSRVGSIARKYDQITREAEKERARQQAQQMRRRARPPIAPRVTADVIVSAKDALREDSDEEGNSSAADDELDSEAEEDKNGATKVSKHESKQILQLPSEELYLHRQPRRPSAHSVAQSSEQPPLASSEGSDKNDKTGTDSAPSVPPSPSMANTLGSLPRFSSHLSESEMSSTGTERSSIMKTLTNLWNYRGAEFTPLEYPDHTTEHIMEDSRIIVREEEPSSIIAFGLTSRKYKDMMQEPCYPVATASEPFMPEHQLGHGSQRVSTWDVVEMQTGTTTDIDEPTMKRPIERGALRLSWDSPELRVSLKVFYADQFDALRRNCRCEELFIESLARCAKWDAQGGKSGSGFLKTKDERFIIKEMSAAEMKALVEFAPKYFEHMNEAFLKEIPTVLAKILGFFRLAFRSSTSGKSRRMDVLVMENIYYNRNIGRQFDLKGSIRNRHADVPVGEAAKTCVLLDENLIESAYKDPLYLREHTKKHLQNAIHNDSKFLAELNIMDYSLIVGEDTASGELVVAIIDFLRPYTWDKRLETWVKVTAYIGGGSREPTVLNPAIYRDRFREAMNRYFLLVPDRWASSKTLKYGRVPVVPTSTTDTKTRRANNAKEQKEPYIGGLTQRHTPSTVGCVPLVPIPDSLS